jgi:putative restriction endonuclease
MYEFLDIKEGAFFKDREELRKAGIHSPNVAGIDGNSKDGAVSIVLNGGYIDDYDQGDLIIYTGHGGNKDRKQIEDQSWNSSGNNALIISELRGLPVRVTRGWKHDSKYSPKEGYKFGGYYRVTRHFTQIGKHGFLICRFQLENFVLDSLEMVI